MGAYIKLSEFRRSNLIFSLLSCLISYMLFMHSSDFTNIVFAAVNVCSQLYFFYTYIKIEELKESIFGRLLRKKVLLIHVFLFSNIVVIPVILLNIIVAVIIQEFMIIVLIGYIAQILVVYLYLKGKNISQLFTLIFLINIIMINIFVII